MTIIEKLNTHWINLLPHSEGADIDWFLASREAWPAIYAVLQAAELVDQEPFYPSRGRKNLRKAMNAMKEQPG